MKYRIWFALVAIAALWSGISHSALVNIENALETEVSRVTLPGSAPGQVVVRECSSCKPVVLGVTANTRYLVGRNTAPVSLAEFRQAAGADRKGLMYVFYRIDTGIVTRIVLAVAG